MGEANRMTRVVLIENHDEAYSLWYNSGVIGRILLNADIHYDMWWIPQNGQITIANYTYPCLKKGMIREVFWVVPDQSWETSSNRKALLRHLREIVKAYPGSKSTFVVENKCVSAVVLGKPLTICSVEGLPPIDEEVLLDLDVDYLMIPYVCYGKGGDKHGAVPWCWPEQQLSRLAARRIRTDLATVAYSVEGGYTPLRWKYLGDELAALLRGEDPAGPLLKGMQRIRQGATAAADRAFDLPEERYREATDLLPDVAAPHHHLAQLYLEMNRIAEARNCYERTGDIGVRSEWH
jgi:hypothetical protein